MINFIVELLKVFLHYTIEVLPSLAAGFLISGIIHEFIPGNLVEKHLGGKGIKPLLYTAFIGTLLPICCVGSLPVAVSLHKKGARIGAVLAFLVATPATSVSALFVSYTLLGLKFTVFIFLATILMGLIIGAIGNLFKFRPKLLDTPASCCHKEHDNSCELEKAGVLTDPICGMTVSEDADLWLIYNGRKFYFCSPHCKAEFEKHPEDYTAEVKTKKRFGQRVISLLKFAFVDMVKDIGLEILLGLVLAAIVVTVAPIGRFVGMYLSGVLAYPFSLVLGIMMYVCSTASVPLVDALVNQGMNVGAGMVLLIVGPVTSWGTILVLKSQFGGKLLAYYLISISVLALILGYVFTLT